jgi:phosphoribosyl 1,2-cyclic phosphodiesterase
MRFSVLGSGSRGNAVFIESGNTGILIDAGFSGKELEKRLGAIARSLSDVQALCITHEHNDHICGAGVISRRWSIPAYANYGTFIAGEKKMGKLFKFKEFETGDTLTIGDLQVRSFRISHDTADPVGYVISDGKKSVGYCTDTGKVSHLMEQRLKGCNGVILEFNHNPEMLKNGPYPLPLQQRVRSSLGHLSNEDAADFLAQLLKTEMDHLVLAHLSEKNNTPELAAKAARRSITESSGVNMHIAPQDRPLGLIKL